MQSPSVSVINMIIERKFDNSPKFVKQKSKLKNNYKAFRYARCVLMMLILWLYFVCLVDFYIYYLLCICFPLCGVVPSVTSKSIILLPLLDIFQ